MSRKSLIGIGFSISVLFLVSGLYTNCQPIGDGFGNSRDASSVVDPDNELPTEPGATLTKGQDLWVNTLEPLMKQQTSCGQCHALPFQGGTAPLTIFNYALMKPLAQPGPTASNNPFINRPKGLLGGHPNICPGDVNGSVTPCKEIKDWVLAEYPLLTDGKAGVVAKTDLVGRITGWVADPANFAVAVNAIFYVDGPVGIGTLAGNQLANLNGIGATNGHYFNFQLPAALRDGVERDLYVYADTAVADNLIPFMPERTQAFTPSAIGTAARDIYEGPGGVRAIFTQRCAGCHTPDYNLDWNRMGTPTPLAGATSTNNELINYMNGQNNHSGGGYCGGNKGNEPCATVARWWAAEFQ